MGGLRRSSRDCERDEGKKGRGSAAEDGRVRALRWTHVARTSTSPKKRSNASSSFLTLTSSLLLAATPIPLARLDDAAPDLRGIDARLCRLLLLPAALVRGRLLVDVSSAASAAAAALPASSFPCPSSSCLNAV